MKILFIGDIIGQQGISVVKSTLETFKQENRQYDFIIANVENAAGGFGINKDAWDKLSELNIDCMTSGNHIWDRPDISKYINDEPKLLRPANYPQSNPGFGWQVYEVNADVKIAVVNLQGRIFMPTIDCPFITADKILEEIGLDYNNIIVDFHAEATSEKQAMGWYLDGRVSVVVGTHTHVQTADERLLPGGTGVITDVGMCGPYDSIIGMEIEPALFRLLKGRSSRLKVASDNLKFAGVEIEIDENNGKCKCVNRILRDA